MQEGPSSNLDLALDRAVSEVRAEAIPTGEPRGRSLVPVAVGVLMERHGLSYASGRAKLESLATTAHVSLETMAAELVSLGGTGRPPLDE